LPVNQPFFELDFGLPTGDVRGIVNECLASSRRTGPVQVAAVNRIGRTITYTVACSPLNGNSDGEGAVMLMEEAYRD
jgi:two-component system CheB/CheR fusion protein